jgi:hypothetical protein
MSPPPIQSTDGDKLFDEIIGVGKQIAAMIEPLPSADIAIPRSSWTVAEAAAHLAMANGLMADIAADKKPDRYGDGTGAGLAEANQQALLRFRERDPATLATTIADRAEFFVRAARQRPATDTVDTPLGLMPMEILARYLLAHMLSHGTAMSEALRKPPIVRPDQVELMVPFLTATLPRLLKKEAIAGVNLRYEIRLRGGTRFTALIVDGTVTINDSGSRPSDCVISAEPVAFFLLAMGLRQQWRLIATGKLRSWGRRPWVATRFVKFFAAP